MIQLRFKGRELLSCMVFFLFSQSVLAQLNDFTLTVAATPETCTGNGAIGLTTSGTTAGASIIYSVFLLPNTVTPIATLSANSITGLVAGNYLVVATQSLGNLTNTQQQNVTITNNVTPLGFQLTGFPGNCLNGSITVTAQGNVSSYEIISGPQIIPPQSSNVFTGLSTGTYNIRVTDVCGDALVQTYTLQGSTSMLVSALALECRMIDCDTTEAFFTVSADTLSVPGMVIAYPLQVTITVHPPGGAPPVVLTQTINSGDSVEEIISANIPFFSGVAYTYEIAVTDACGHTFSNTGNEILEEYTVTLDPTPNGALNGLKIEVCHGMPPYTVNFLASPPGFDPLNHNPNHPGPFPTDLISYTSNSINEMPDGLYTVNVTDSCGNSFTGDVTVNSCATSFGLVPVCPDKMRFDIPGPDGGSLVATAEIIAAPANFGHPLPFDLAAYITAPGYLEIVLPPGNYTVNGQLVCGSLFTFHPEILAPTVQAEGINGFGCSSTTGGINLELLGGFNLVSVVIVSAPAGFNQSLPYDASEYILPNDESEKCEIPGLAFGDYVLEVTDTCGTVYAVNVNVPLIISQDPPFFRTLQGCGAGYGAAILTCANLVFQQVIITAAPAAYPFPLPHDVSFNIAPTGTWFMNTLPEGDYAFYTKDLCGVEHTFDRTIQGFHVVKNEVELLGNCGSFDLRVDFSPADIFAQSFWLQKYDAATNKWVHPFTGVAQQAGLPPDTPNAYALTNAGITYNIATFGHFRVARRSQVYYNGSSGWLFCWDVLHEFDFSGQLKISSAYSIPCSNGNSQVIIIAGDTHPLTYRITEKDGLPFLVDNGENNIFSGLSSGVYNFQVEDECGNIANRLFDIVSLSEPQIMPHNLCNGQTGFLSVQPISYLNYQWWNGNNPTAILSTSNSLYFSPFSQTASPGTYFVRIYSPTALSCIDVTLSYTILPNFLPNAGQDAAVTLCGGSSAIDLTTLLGAPFDTNGYWTETTSSGLLNGHTWLPIGLPQGTYIFKYRVNGFCADFDEATVTINFRGAAPIPAITVDQESCSGGVIQFTANNVLDATYHWTGPNNFSSNLQNPTIPSSTPANSGEYQLTIDVNDCQATATAQVTVNSSADFDLVQSCDGGVFRLKAVPKEGGFNPELVTYVWTGPQNFTSSENPIAITGMSSGEYSVTVAHNPECEVTRSIAVSTTRCGIPLGISPNNDGKNDIFDLSGFDVLKFKIYNRYGRMVFEQNNYTNQWYGQDFNGNILPDATYYYYIRLGTGEEKTGWVYVTK